jgi:hypothetical protein
MSSAISARARATCCADEGQGPGAGEDRTDESHFGHATVAVSAQAAIRLLHGLIGRKTAEGRGKRRIKREN